MWAVDVIQDFHVSESHHPKSSCEFWKRTPKFNWRDCLQNYIYWPAPISIEIRQVKKNISLSLSLSLLISLSKWEWEWEYEENEKKVKQKKTKAKQQWRGRGGKKRKGKDDSYEYVIGIAKHRDIPFFFFLSQLKADCRWERHSETCLLPPLTKAAFSVSTHSLPSLISSHYFFSLHTTQPCNYHHLSFSN